MKARSLLVVDCETDTRQALEAPVLQERMRPCHVLESPFRPADRFQERESTTEPELRFVHELPDGSLSSSSVDATTTTRELGVVFHSDSSTDNVDANPQRQPAKVRCAASCSGATSARPGHASTSSVASLGTACI
jgi:hypothetical protein